ncbi:MAG TPA: hypothetical protein VIJ28_16875 [Chloroflexota bacterium]|jgi:hypothetical protein
MSTSPTPVPDEPQSLPAPPAPKVRVRVPATPAVRVRRASPFEQLFDGLRNTVLSEETLVLMEFLIVAAIGVIAFVTVYPTASHAIDSLANYLNKQFNTTF